MAFATAKISEMPLRNSLPLTSHSHLLFSSTPKQSFRLLKPFSALRTTEHGGTSRHSHKSKPSASSSSSSNAAPWLNKWPPRGQPPPEPPRHKDRVQDSDGREKPARYTDKDKGQSAIERIVFRLRNLGLGDEDDDEEDGDGAELDSMPAATGAEKLGDLLQREWVRPDYILAEEGDDDVALPWEKEEEEMSEDEEEVKGGMRRERRPKAPSLAELTIEDEELRRLRRLGMFLRERISVPKAGITQAVLEKIHDKWRKEELVRLKFHEVLAHDMKTAHEIVEVRQVP